MNLAPTLQAIIVASLPGESRLQEGEGVNVVGLERKPNARWRVRIVGGDGKGTTLRPCLVRVRKGNGKYNKAHRAYFQATTLFM